MEKITRKSLLYKSRVKYANFALNHVWGCCHGCTYPCYAFMDSKWHGQASCYNDWIKPKLVSNALELLEEEIPKYKKDINAVYMCFATDPFMYKQKEVIDLSLKIIARLNKDDIKVVTVSKGIYPKALIKKDIYGTDNEYGSTIVSLSEEFREKYEHFAPPIAKRIESLKFLHNNGLKTWVSIEPYPTPNIFEQDLEKILQEVSFVDKIIFGRLNRNKLVSEFKGHKEFYNDCAAKVLEFCKKNGIECYIKGKTISK